MADQLSVHCGDCYVRIHHTGSYSCFHGRCLETVSLASYRSQITRCIERQVPIHAVSSHEWVIRAKREPLYCPLPVALKSTNHGKQKRKAAPLLHRSQAEMDAHETMGETDGPSAG